LGGVYIDFYMSGEKTLSVKNMFETALLEGKSGRREELQRKRNPPPPSRHQIIMEEEAAKKALAKEAFKLLLQTPGFAEEKIQQVKQNIAKNVETGVIVEDDYDIVDDDSNVFTACPPKKRKGVETVWSELVATWLFIVPDEEKNAIKNKEDLKNSIDSFCDSQQIIVDPVKKVGYYADLDLPKRTWLQIKSYIDNFKLPEEFTGNPVIQIWCSGKTFDKDDVPFILNSKLQDPKDMQSDCFFKVLHPLYEGQHSIVIGGGGGGASASGGGGGPSHEAYYGGVNLKTTNADPLTNFSIYKFISEEDLKFCLELFQNTIASIMQSQGVQEVSREYMNSEFSIHDHVFWEFIGIILFDKNNFIAQRLTECIYALKAQEYYACYKYDGTKIVNFHKLSENINPSLTTITQDVVKTQTSNAAKLFFKLNTFYDDGTQCEVYNGELRFKNPKFCTDKSGHSPQIILMEPKYESKHKNKVKSTLKPTKKGGSHKRKTLKKRKTRRRK
jgi:hypothetical protein